MCSDDYVANAIKNVEGKLAEANRRLCVKVSTPMTVGYRPELDMTRLLSDEQANYYQNLIGVLRWAVELGQIDIHVQVAILSSYLAQLASRPFRSSISYICILAEIQEVKSCI